MAWMPFLKLVSPASAYVRRAKEQVRGQRRGRPRRMNPGSRLRPLAVWAAPDPHESGLFPRGPSHWAERRRELDVAHREDVTRGAEELLRTGATVIPTSGDLCTHDSSDSGTARRCSIVGRRQPKGPTVGPSHSWTGENSRGGRSAPDTSWPKSSCWTTRSTPNCGGLTRLRRCDPPDRHRGSLAERRAISPLIVWHATVPYRRAVIGSVRDEP